MATSKRVAVRTASISTAGGDSAAKYHAALANIASANARRPDDLEALRAYSEQCEARILELQADAADDLERADAAHAAIMGELRAELNRAHDQWTKQIAKAEAEAARYRDLGEAQSKQWMDKFTEQGKDWQSKLEKEIAAGAARLDLASSIAGSALAEARNRWTQERTAFETAAVAASDALRRMTESRDSYKTRCDKVFAISAPVVPSPSNTYSMED